MIAVITANIWRAVAIAALTALFWQSNRIEGWVILNGLEQDIVELEAQVEAERKSHRETKSIYTQAQATAALQQELRVANVKVEQERIANEVSSNFRDRIATLDQRVLELSRARASSSRVTHTASVPSVPDATSGAVGSPNDLSLAERVDCIRQAIQLDELINFVEEQAGSDRFSPISVTPTP